MASMAAWHYSTPDVLKSAKEDESTTEEEVNSAIEENTSQESEPEVLSASEEPTDITHQQEVIMQLDEEVEREQKQEALRQYGERFGRETAEESSSDVPVFSPNYFSIHKEHMECARKPEEQVLAELFEDLDLKVGQESPATTKALPLKCTFGYAGSLSKRAPFAKFDIRDEICMEVGGFKHGQIVRDRNGGELVVVGVKRVAGVPRLCFQPKDLGRSGAGAFQSTSAAANKLRVTLVPDRKESLCEMQAEKFDGAEDSDGEDFLLCRHCRLPVGTQCFIHGDKKEMPLHRECLAQMMREEVQSGEQLRKQKDSETKKGVRKDYDIGWRVEQVPRSMLPAMKLGCQPVPRGMCCLLFNEEGHSVQVAPTLMPAASMNLEYLSIALQVRLREGREPLFSLDPMVDLMQEKKDVMQEKRYDPEWLSGTSVGDVLFQADYHLKELSMGEYEQPVLGMKSCIDLAEDMADRKAWHAREWFIVRKAEVLLNEENVLLPRVQMGIEAREQVLGEAGGLQDKAVTRPNHPLVKYANQFTHNFDLIAERKSVIYHLRDLARASVVAKMLIENEVNMYGPWLDLGGDVREISSLEVPQLWNARLYSQIQVGSTSIVAEEDKERCHGVYGGVNFGLQATSISMPSAITQGRVSAINLARAAAGPSAGLSAITTSKARMASLAALAPEVTLSAMAVAAAPAVSAVGRPVIGAAAPPPPAVAVTKSSRTALAPGAVEKPSKPSAGIAAVMEGISLGEPGRMARLAPKTLARPGVPAALEEEAAPSAPGAPAAMVTMPTVPTKASAGLSAVMIAPRAAVPTMINPPTFTKPVTVPLPGVKPVETRVFDPLAALKAPEQREEAERAVRVTEPPPRQVAAVVKAAPRGVDLNLDQFSIAQPTRVEGLGWGEAVDVKCVAMGDLFWSSIESDSVSVFQEDDKELLKAVFNPTLSDRREEGEYFVPPDTSANYVQRLRSLVCEETCVREHRKDDFLSSRFSMVNPGELFPKSWVPAAEITDAKTSQSSCLHARPDYKKHVHKLAPVLKSTAPVFNEASEDGIRYRIYHLGHLEVRTTQEPQNEEVIGAVFSKKPLLQTEKGPTVDEHEKVVKVSEYIEKAHGRHSSYVVIETDRGNVVVTEMLMDGSVTWEENPTDAEYRNSIAKVIRSDENDHRVIIRFLKNFQLKENECNRLQISQSTCKLYAQKFYSRATGEIGHVYSGLAKQQEDGAWQLPECKYGLYAQGNQALQASPAERQADRPSVGDKVQVMDSGRVGKVEVDERAEEMPYKVSFNDGKRPKSKWYKECDVQFA
mmetsp:Transcript_27208/g.47191  ORF Transcript_27208/g.47191 Transcript_27208/m.47191 type:complete len:1295 (-) Transcript_27208:200-4084(-)